MDYIKLVKDKKTSMGALYLFEGELMKIIVKNAEDYKAGDTITCLYTGIKFSSKVLKVRDNNLYVLVPQFYEQFPNNKRQHPRLRVSLSAYLHDEQSQLMNVKVLDLSRKGIGIMAEQPLIKAARYKLYIEDKVAISAEIAIRNESKSGSMYRYGCEIISINEENEFILRKFILSEQLTTNMVKEESE